MTTSKHQRGNLHGAFAQYEKALFFPLRLCVSARARTRSQRERELLFHFFRTPKN